MYHIKCDKTRYNCYHYNCTFSFVNYYIDINGVTPFYNNQYIRVHVTNMTLHFKVLYGMMSHTSIP